MLQTTQEIRTRGFYGLEPDRLTGTTLAIRPGHCFGVGGAVILDLPTGGTLDIGNVGLWGREASSPFVDGDDVFLYVVGNPTTKEVGVIASTSLIYTGVTYPPGFTEYRKHPIALKYRTAFGGLPTFHLGSGSGRIVRYTEASYSGPHTAIANHKTLGVWHTIALAPWLPDSARIAIVETRVRYTSGAAGSAFFRSIGIGGTGRILGSGTPTSGFDVAERTIRVGSTAANLAIEVQTTGDADLSLVVLGYESTEPV